MAERPDLDAIERNRETARQVVADLCDGKRDWIMSIPARPDHDPDLLIAQALRDQTALLTYCRELEAENKWLREAWEDQRAM